MSMETCHAKQIQLSVGELYKELIVNELVAKLESAAVIKPDQDAFGLTLSLTYCHDASAAVRAFLSQHSDELLVLDAPVTPSLPSGQCTICLDDHEDLVVVLPCDHWFHWACLAEYERSVCPICRSDYSSRPQQCDQCDLIEGLWLCLMCGHVNCSRQQWQGADDLVTGRGHALAHFQATGHFKARNVTTGRVWNYITDDYDQDDGVRPPTETKETSLMLEYTHSLTLELDAQRVRFEKQLIEVRKRLDAQQREMRADLERLQQSYRELSEQLLSASKQQKESHASVLQARTRLRKTVEQVAEEQAFVDALKAKPPPASETMKSKPNPKLARLEKQLSKLMAKRSALYAALA
eukprot:TRINITY_DN9539_c0_g1_i1.p1 TRINITY_DN9539_c0_g1~~TRINITY_DN9539_c0_g1_i1.p1  ORF type:complete len:352 (+),score=57.39 TRINITY_DN9539_c0_g1_i1:84-1139(+)